MLASGDLYVMVILNVLGDLYVMMILNVHGDFVFSIYRHKFTALVCIHVYG